MPMKPILPMGSMTRSSTMRKAKLFCLHPKQMPIGLKKVLMEVPLFTGKVAVKNRKIGELGLSYMGGIYNKYQEDGLTLDKKRPVNVFAVDFNTTLPKSNTYINGEWAWVRRCA